MTKNNHVGSDFDDFLAEEGILETCQAEAAKRIIAWQIKEYMARENLKKTALAQKLGTSRSQLDRLLDPENTSLNLKTLASAARVMGKKIEIKLV